MDIWNSDKLILFIGFVIPGFVSLKAYQLLFQSEPKKSSKQFVDAIAYSCLNYAILFWPIYQVEAAGLRTTYPGFYVAFYAFVLFIAPVSWACVLKKLRNTQLFKNTLHHPTGKPWDYVFAQGKSYWIVVTLKDGTSIGGRFDSASFASSTPYPEQIYLEESWVLNSDGGFERPKEQTAGIIILAPDIKTVEMYNLTYGGSNG